MIRISRVRQPSVQLLEQLSQRVLFPDGENQGPQFIQTLVKYLHETPEHLFLVAAMKDEELVGFIIAQNLPDHVSVLQLWSKEGNSWKIADELYMRLLLWTIGMGKDAIRGETQREITGFYRRAGFVERNIVIEKRVDSSMVERLMSKAREVFSE